MCTFSKITALALPMLAVTAGFAQGPGDSSWRIQLPKDAPVAVVSANWGDSKSSARGGAVVLDLHTSLALKNIGGQRIRGVTLLVTAQEVAPGGKASVAVPSLDVAPGETFPVRIDLRLLRPLAGGTGPLVEIGLDGVLFETLGFYGPDKLNSRRSLTAWELEARRDRQHFKSILTARGGEGLRQEMVASLARQAAHPRLDVQVARGRTTNQEAGRDVQVAFVRMPDSPVEALDSVGHVAGNEARLPHIELVNHSDRAVKYLEIAMLVADGQGRRYVAGAVPGEVRLGPGQKGALEQRNGLRINSAGSITGVSGYVSQVEFTDGTLWVPSRASLADPALRMAANCSPEEQRLGEIYRKKGLTALIEELKKF